MAKNNSLLLIMVAALLICLFSGVAGYYIKSEEGLNLTISASSATETTTEEKCEEKTCPEVTCKENETECVCPTCEEKNTMHVFSYFNDGKGYDIYSYLQNQGSNIQLINWKGELLLLEEAGNDISCIFDLENGNVNYEKHTLGTERHVCKESNDYWGYITKLNIKTSDIRTAKVLNSCRSDGADFELIVYNNGTVKEIFLFESGISNDNYFADYKVKDILAHDCYDEKTKSETYTLLLEDGTTKEVTVKNDK